MTSKPLTKKRAIRVLRGAEIFRELPRPKLSDSEIESIAKKMVGLDETDFESIVETATVLLSEVENATGFYGEFLEK